MDRERATEILNLYLFEDVLNNRNHYEDTHDITYVGDHFAVLERSTGVIHTFKVVFEPSDLPANEWIDAFNDQEWLEE